MTAKVDVDKEMTLSSLSSNIESVFQSVTQKHQPAIVRQGDESMVLISFSDYVGMFNDDTDYLMSNPDTKARLLQSMKNVEEEKNLTKLEI